MGSTFSSVPPETHPPNYFIINECGTVLPTQSPQLRPQRIPLLQTKKELGSVLIKNLHFIVYELKITFSRIVSHFMLSVRFKKKKTKILGSLPSCRLVWCQPTELIITTPSIVNVCQIVFAPLRARFRRHASICLSRSQFFRNPAVSFKELKMNPSGTSRSGRTFLFTSESVGQGHAGNSVGMCGRVYPLGVASARNSKSAVTFECKVQKTASIV